ncbi:energy transducer TonB [Pseudomonas syringae]|uniref:energy transducer TonB n=1 Tax=Pseudomonas syringae TaxID=317 RepID=UPI00215AEB98|nr:energy transducer TonB [Pseudomonas syringae]MCR8719164.1 energy transducer TonB [Pseudomonas syringae]
MSGGLSVIVLAGLLWAGAAQALPSYPVPLYMPEPDYPASMRHTLVKNSVTVRIFIQADGGVRFLEVQGATDPRFISLTRSAVEQWTFEPWEPPDSHPEGEAVTVTFTFTGRPHTNPPLTSNAELKQELCWQLNREMFEGRKWRMDVKPDVIMRTELYLSSGPVIEQFLTLDKRQALVLELREAVPGIIAQCQKNPTRRYVDYLPENVRNAL